MHNFKKGSLCELKEKTESETMSESKLISISLVIIFWGIKNGHGARRKVESPVTRQHGRALSLFKRRMIMSLHAALFINQQGVGLQGNIDCRLYTVWWWGVGGT